MRFLLLWIMVSFMLMSCGTFHNERQLNKFIDAHVKEIQPLEKEANLAYWQAATTGQPQAFEQYSQLQLQLKRIYSNKDDFEFLKKMKFEGGIRDSLLKRQLQLLYNSYLENQIASELLEQIVAKSTEIEQKFSTFRGTIAGKRVSGNEINEILKNETNSKKRQQAWLASKMVGPTVAEDIIELVKLRNQAAQSLGFKDYRQMALTLGEQEGAELDEIFMKLCQLTDQPFAQIKAEIDEKLAHDYYINVADLQPWHYHDPFFQEAPLLQSVDLDKFYQSIRLESLAMVFFAGLGLPVADILANSDLYEREGKNPHAFCTDIDREGDVRILCNLRNNEHWMGVLLHELGHAVYDKYHDPALPYLLRRPAHAFTTEAIANLFGRLSRDAAWMQSMLSLTDTQSQEIEAEATKSLGMQMLVFARWSMVMYDFEKELYADPDQNLNELWWELVERYQGIRKPANRNQPDWATKIHIAIYPCYYHNYLLGELLASQLQAFIAREILKEGDTQSGYVAEPLVGEYLRDRIFKVGASLHWSEMIKRAAGEPLNAKYFVEQFVHHL